MVLPMLEALGYDIWNPAEVCPEYESDTAIKKGGQKEKVDYSIIINEQPRIFIEAKALGTELDGHHGQLKRYFNSTPSVSLAILTNGIEFHFYTDTVEPNIQDDVPFYTLRIDSIEQQGLEILLRFQKSVFSPEAIRDYATEITYTEKIYEFLLKEIDVRSGQLSEGFIRWILGSSNMYEGRVTSNVVERFQEISKNALQRVIRKIVRRSVAALDNEVGTNAEQEPEDKPETVDASKEDKAAETAEIVTEETTIEKKGVVTTEEELNAFAIVKRLFETSALAGKNIFDPATRKHVPVEIAYKDTVTYFGIYFNKASWWNLRLSLSSRIKWIGFNLTPEEAADNIPNNVEVLEPTSLVPLRIKINSIEDLDSLNQLIFLSFQKTINEKERYA